MSWELACGQGSLIMSYRPWPFASIGPTQLANCWLKLGSLARCACAASRCAALNDIYTTKPDLDSTGLS